MRKKINDSENIDRVGAATKLPGILPSPGSSKRAGKSRNCGARRDIHALGWQMVEGKLHVSASKNPDHVYGGKKVPSGFFDLEGAENISAVLFSNAGTLAKFDRMGIAAGFAAKDYRYFRIGMRYNAEPNAVEGVPFSIEINSSDYKEYWSDELQLFHNPHAKYPIRPEAFHAITQHFFEKGEHYSITPENTVLASRTMILAPSSKKTTV